MIKVGLVGYGVGGRNFHAPLIASSALCELVGVVTRSRDRINELGQDFPGTPVYESLDALLQSGVDVVVISTPPHTRYNLIMQAVKYGTPTVSDKPFALDAKSAHELVDAAQQANVPLTVYMNRRWDSDHLTAKKLIAATQLGYLRRYYNGIEALAPENEGNESGGGLLRDLGSHLVDQARELFGPVTHVYAEITEMPDNPELNDAFYLFLTHKNGMKSHINGNMMQHTTGPRFKIEGDEGCFSIEGLDIQTGQAFSRKTPATEGNAWGREPESRWGRIQRADKVEVYPSERGSWPAFYEMLAHALQGQGELPVNPCDALAVTEILDAALISSRENRVVEVAPPSTG